MGHNLVTQQQQIKWLSLGNFGQESGWIYVLTWSVWLLYTRKEQGQGREVIAGQEMIAMIQAKGDGGSDQDGASRSGKTW